MLTIIYNGIRKNARVGPTRRDLASFTVYCNHCGNPLAYQTPVEHITDMKLTQLTLICTNPACRKSTPVFYEPLRFVVKTMQKGVALEIEEIREFKYRPIDPAKLRDPKEA